MKNNKTTKKIVSGSDPIGLTEEEIKKAEETINNTAIKYSKEELEAYEKEREKFEKLATEVIRKISLWASENAKSFNKFEKLLDKEKRTLQSEELYKCFLEGFIEEKEKRESVEKIYLDKVKHYSIQELLIKTPDFIETTYINVMYILSSYKNLWNSIGLTELLTKELKNPYYKGRSLDDLINNYGKEEEATTFLFNAFCRSLGKDVKLVSRYNRILQTNITNQLAHTSKKTLSKNPFEDRGELSINNKNNLKIFLENFNNLRLDVSTQKVLDILQEKLTTSISYGQEASLEQIDEARAVSLSVKEYMEISGLKDRKTAKKQVEEAVKTLFNLYLTWKDNGENGKSPIPYAYVRILDAIGVDIDNPVNNGVVCVKFSTDIAKYLSKAQIMLYPQKLYTINSKLHTHSFYMGRKLAEHHNMNINKKNSNRISVKKLLEALPDMPTYKDVMGKAGQVTKRIIDPFEKNIEALVTEYDVLESWHYCIKNGAPIPEEQLKNYDYKTWITWQIEFKLVDYPNQEERIKQIKERRKKATKKKTEKKEKLSKK